MVPVTVRPVIPPPSTRALASSPAALPAAPPSPVLPPSLVARCAFLLRAHKREKKRLSVSSTTVSRKGRVLQRPSPRGSNGAPQQRWRRWGGSLAARYVSTGQHVGLT
eukprot:1539046-Rhodomonas_salina.1